MTEVDPYHVHPRHKRTIKPKPYRPLFGPRVRKSKKARREQASAETYRNRMWMIGLRTDD